MSIIFLSLLALAQPQHWDFLSFPADRFADEANGGGLLFDGKTDPIYIEDKSQLPNESMTVSAWVSIDEPNRWGGIIGCIQDNDDLELGWILGYNESQFTMALSTMGADDGNGTLTYLASGDAKFELGKWHHVASTYDGKKLQLFVDGVRVNQTEAQSGSILYNKKMPFTIGGYEDDNELNKFNGRIKSVTLESQANSDEQIKKAFAEGSWLKSYEPWVDTELEWLVFPYLNWPTANEMSVSFETTLPTTIELKAYHETGRGLQTLSSSKERLHHLRLTDLEPNEKYFYAVRATDFRGEIIESPLLSFRTAPEKEDSFTFIAIGDTQAQAKVVKRVSDVAYSHRPNLVVHAGDLVTTGSNKSHWTGHFFPAMQPLISRVPFMPVLGNHEQDAQHYYDYMVLPEPERYYSFTFGNAEFFMIDGNRSLAEQSEQLKWLQNALAQSKAKWKFAVLHQPPYTSDSNDYGDTYHSTSTRGDMNARNIVSVLEKNGVDICFSGHVHDYERTFPIAGNKVIPWKNGGVLYVTTAGGGGHLEHFDPTNTWFGHKKANCHHLIYIAIHGDILEFQAIDEFGKLFDVITLDKGALARKESN